MRQAESVAQTDLSLPPNSYVYSILPLPSCLVASCSDDSIHITSEELKPIAHVPNCHSGLTSLATIPNTTHLAALTAGRDGFFRSWDLRTQKKALEGNNVSGAPILSLATSALSDYIAVGTELANHQATVTVWDPRALTQPVVTYVDSHNDDVTELVWHPTSPGFLLSGSTDGLLNLYDTKVKDEDEAVVRTWNHGSVSHAAWPSGAGIEDGHEVIYAVSHDEQLAVYRIPLGEGDSSAGTHYKVVEEEDVENEALKVGDVRPKFDCEYVVDFASTGDNIVVAVGKHSESRIDLVDLTESLRAGAPSEQNTIRIQDAHDGEIVRTFLIGDNQVIYTGGEDGTIRAWTIDKAGQVNETKTTSREKFVGKEKKTDSKSKRFAPY